MPIKKAHSARPTTCRPNKRTPNVARAELAAMFIRLGRFCIIYSRDDRPLLRRHSKTLLQLLNVEPVSPRLLNASVPRDLEIICLQCLNKEPARRYNSA